MKSAGLMSIVSGAKGSEEADREWVAGAFVRGEADVRDVTVTGRTLSEILDEAGAPEIDLLSLDLEGFEVPALRGLDLERHGPRWLLVEAHEPEDASPHRGRPRRPLRPRRALLGDSTSSTAARTSRRA